MKRINTIQKILGVILVAVMLLCALNITVSAAHTTSYTRKNVADPSAQSKGRAREVYVGGMPFGVKFFTDGVLVVGFSDSESGVPTSNPARDAGIRLKDVIIKINGTAINSAADLTRAVEASGGAPMVFTVKRAEGRRGGNVNMTEMNITVTPIKVNDEGGPNYKTGVWVRDSGAGIGTVTFILPATNEFAGLGHGICDGDTGELIPMQRGVVTDVTISGIERGLAGAPGAIKGYFKPVKTGAIVGNTQCGVYGVFANRPSKAKDIMTVARKNEIKEGAAKLRCTLDGGEIEDYSVAISAIDYSASGSKCFTVKITDSKLIEKTGGIVQGMSGSPIIQNGKLVGAVTHVLVNDPTMGYGIFIENMLDKMSVG